MPIIWWPTSLKQIRAFQAGLSQLAQLRPFPANLVIRPHPLPVYNLNVRELVASDDTGLETLVSWRYFATGDSGAALAGDLDLAPRPRLTRLSYGDPVLDALKVAKEKEELQKVPDMQTRAYEPRLLRVPGLFVEAFWLKALAPPEEGKETGWIVPYHTFLDIDPFALYSLKDFRGQLSRLVAAEFVKRRAPSKLG
jgi:hypothetical protein